MGAVVVGAGRGERMGAGVPKAFRELRGRPLLWYSLSTLERVEVVGEVAVVVPPGWEERARQLVSSKVKAVVPGGKTRQESVRLGLEALLGLRGERGEGDSGGARGAEGGDFRLGGQGFPGTGLVIVHDAARPLATPGLFRKVVASLLAEDEGAGGAVPVLPVRESLKAGADGGLRSVPREGVLLAQTPQVFWAEALIKGHLLGRNRLLPAADDAELVEEAGYRILGVPGEETNIKVTTEADLVVASSLLETELREELLLEPEALALGGPGGEIRVGVGYDLHPLRAGRPLVLGGVSIPHEVGLEGHSDADVICHAVADALLGAAALGDLGALFPSGDPRLAGVSSLKLLGEVVARLAGAGWRPVNADVSLVLERPRVAPYLEEMRSLLAGVLGVERERVSVKAVSPEGLGALGREEGASAIAVCLVSRRRS